MGATVDRQGVERIAFCSQIIGGFVDALRGDGPQDVQRHIALRLAALAEERSVESVERRRAYMAADRAVRHFAPVALSAAGLGEEAGWLYGAPSIFGPADARDAAALASRASENARIAASAAVYHLDAVVYTAAFGAAIAALAAVSNGAGSASGAAAARTAVAAVATIAAEQEAAARRAARAAVDRLADEGGDVESIDEAYNATYAAALAATDEREDDIWDSVLSLFDDLLAVE